MATTINSYSVKLGLDAKDYIRNSDLSRKETAQLTRTINASRTPADNYSRSIHLLEKAHKSGAIATSTYNILLDRQKDKLNAGSVAATGMTSRIKSMAAAYLGLAAAAGSVKKSIGLAVEVEQAETQFEVLTNSANNAKVLMRDLRDFAARSPITFTGATDSARTMLLFNVQAQDVMRNVKMLGEITGGNNERFKNLTLAFSQMTSAGRLLGQDLRQMVDAGFNPLQQISLKTGESLTSLKERMEDGAVSSQEVTQAFIDATAEGGRFHGMADRIAETMGGKMTIAMSELEQSGVRLGEALSPLVITLTKGFSDGIGPLSALMGIVSKIADGYGFLIAIATDAAHAVTLPFKAMMGTLEDDDIPSAINDFLDLMDKRDMERAAAKNNPLGGLENVDQPINHMADAVDDLGEAAEKATIQMDAHVKARDKHLKAMEKADNRRMESALKNAQAHFAAERKMQADRAQQLANTSIESIELGSDDAAKFMADQRNRLLASSSRPNAANETPQQLLTEAKKQYAVLLAQEKTQREQKDLLKKMLDEQKQNGFRRIR